MFKKFFLVISFVCVSSKWIKMIECMKVFLQILLCFSGNGDRFWTDMGKEEQKGLEAGEQGVGAAGV